MTKHDDFLKQTMRLVTYHRTRIWWIVSRVFALAVGVTVFSMVLNPKYVAQTTLTLLPTRSELGFASMRPEVWSLSPAALLGHTHQEAMMSRTLAEDVARTLLAENAQDLANGGFGGRLRRVFVAPVAEAFHRAVTLLNTGRWRSADPLTALADTIRARTRVRNLPGSFVFQIAVTWENPSVAARIANLMAERYMDLTLRTNQAEMRATREYLSGQIKDVEQALAVLQQKIADYRSGKQLYSITYNTAGDVDLALQELSQVLRALATVRADRQQLEARLEAMKPYQTPAALGALDAERIGLKARQDAIEKIIDEQLAKLNSLPAKEAELIDLYRERTIKERALTGLQDRLLETKVAEAAQISSVRVIDTAVPPLYPERPLLLRNGAAALMVGLLLSIGFVLLTESRRGGLRSREDMGAAREAMLGVVPYVAACGHDDPDTQKAGKTSEFFRSMIHGTWGTVAHRRTVKRHLEHLLIRLSEGEGRVFMFVSLNGGEGKTFMVEQLAMLAREAGLRILLIDAGLDHPALHLAFGRPLGPGLSEVLLGKAKAKDVVVTVEPGVDFLCAGVEPTSGLARWELAACKEQLRSLAAGYDLVLIDSPAFRQSPSVGRLFAVCDRVVCVFDAMSSAREDLDAFMERMRGLQTGFGIVLNKVLYKADYLFEASGSKHRDLERGKTAGQGVPYGAHRNGL